MSDKSKNIINTFLFFTIFIVIFFIDIIMRDNYLSNSERRKLNQFPKISLENIINTKFMNDFDKYVLDQFIFRDSFRAIKSYMEFDLLQKKDNNGLFKQNGYIFKNLYPLNEKAVITTAKRMNYIYDLYLKDMNVYYSIIPDKNFYLDDKYGYLRIDYNKLESIMKENLSTIKYISIFDTLSLDCYYKTDIHWKQDKLYSTVSKISKYMNFNITDDYDRNVIKGFKGSYYGQIAINTGFDDIVYLTNNMLYKAIVYNYETNKTTSVYDLDKVNNIDQYDIFLSGPAAILEINNPVAKTDKELIIFRDSFGSSITPLLIQDYKKITLIDIRYINSDYLGNYVEFKNQDVLFIYSVNIINTGSILR